MSEEAKKEAHLKSGNPNSEKVHEWGIEQKIDTVFERAQKMKPCPIGHVGACCKHCHMDRAGLWGRTQRKRLPVYAVHHWLR